MGKADEEHLEFATAQGRVLITHNRLDFERLASQWWRLDRAHAGIVLAIRRADTYELARHLLVVLNLYDQTGWHDVVMYA